MRHPQTAVVCMLWLTQPLIFAADAESIRIEYDNKVTALSESTLTFSHVRIRKTYFADNNIQITKSGDPYVPIPNMRVNGEPYKELVEFDEQEGVFFTQRIQKQTITRFADNDNVLVDIEPVFNKDGVIITHSVQWRSQFMGKDDNVYERRYDYRIDQWTPWKKINFPLGGFNQSMFYPPSHEHINYSFDSNDKILSDTVIVEKSVTGQAESFNIYSNGILKEKYTLDGSQEFMGHSYPEKATITTYNEDTDTTVSKIVTYSEIKYSPVAPDTLELFN